MDEQEQDDRLERFTRLWMTHQRVVSAFIYMSLRDSHQAEDVLQDVAADASRHFDRYDSSRPFAAWLMGIARQRLVDHYRRQSRRPLQLPPEIEQGLADAYAEVAGEAEDRLDALRKCMQRLPEDQCDLVDRRYGFSESLTEIAARINSNAKAVNAKLTRIRKRLSDCVQQRLEAMR